MIVFFLRHTVVEKVAVHKADVMLGVVELLVEVYQVNHEKTVLKKKKGKKRKQEEGAACGISQKETE